MVRTDGLWDDLSKHNNTKSRTNDSHNTTAPTECIKKDSESVVNQHITKKDWTKEKLPIPRIGIMAFAYSFSCSEPVLTTILSSVWSRDMRPRLRPENNPDRQRRTTRSIIVTQRFCCQDPQSLVWSFMKKFSPTFILNTKIVCPIIRGLVKTLGYDDSEKPTVRAGYDIREYSTQLNWFFSDTSIIPSLV